MNVYHYDKLSAEIQFKFAKSIVNDVNRMLLGHFTNVC